MAGLIDFSTINRNPYNSAVKEPILKRFNELSGVTLKSVSVVTRLAKFTY